jgi:hypothetical protein
MSTAALDRDVELLVRGVALLASDVSAAARLSELHGDTQFARRTYVRAVFALIEGNMNFMAGVVLASAERGEIELTPRELEIARQERVSMEAGRPAVGPKFIPLGDRLSPLMSMFARCHARTYALYKGSSGWVSFSAAIEIRNRITHPRSESAFAVSNAELECLAKGKEWFAASIEELLSACSATTH